MNAADQYYIKALENYPYDLEEAIENVNYSLSYCDDHTGAHCLMGQIYGFQLMEYDKAEYHFDQAMASNIDYPMIYESYIDVLIFSRKLKKAEKLILFAAKITGVRHPMLLHRMAIILEIRKNYAFAIQYLKKAIEASLHSGETEFFNNELKRIKEKKKRA